MQDRSNIKKLAEDYASFSSGPNRFSPLDMKSASIIWLEYLLYFDSAVVEEESSFMASPPNLAKV